ncbi:MAG TPA: nitrilase-related carbon-nitrogen hydrolase [Steroidobacteraceae bacterium]|jgi:N-carbamoylputrescine amidase
MRVTVCQWPESHQAIERAWERLIEHVRAERSALLVLPEMPFSPWLARSREFNAAHWEAAVDAHQRWDARMSEAGSAAIVGTRPYTFGNERLCAAFIWEADTGSRAAHANSRIRNEEGAWERGWYAPAPADFTPAQAAGAEVGFLISLELWDLTEASRYGAEGVQLLITPRAGGAACGKWLDAGVAAASSAGAFGLSSTRAGASADSGGEGWIIDPQGQLLARTTESKPFVTAELDLGQVRHVRSPQHPDLPTMSSTSAT